ncbi:uncharacterized protein [Amphiura filiformis]|uniref:uncharacterized protein n=1 Tax=Amphiura filiformis TaxID=82378 RepID=UPI003B216212
MYYTCHRCKKKLADNEIINNEKAGAPIPEGETDYDYCWDCFAILHDIGFTKDHYDTEDESMIAESDAISETSDATIGNHSDASSSNIETINMHHNDYNEMPCLGSSHKCQHCNKMFSNTLTLRNHKRLFHGEQSTKLTLQYHKNLHHGEIKPRIHGPPYVCKICNKMYASRKSLKRHEPAHSRNTDQKFLCSICSKVFHIESSLKQHELKHDKGNYHHKCNECGKKFFTAWMVKQHVRIHTGEKPFLCSICGKGFNQKVVLKAHERVHKGVMPFPCKYCDKHFVTSSSRNAHEKTHEKYQ